jgi:uncharacterized protein
MKWRGREGSSNIEDRRRMSGGRAGSIGGVGLIAILLIGYFLGIDVTPLLQGGAGGAGTVETSVELTEEDVQVGQFASVVLKDTETVWSDLFPREVGRDYVPTTLVLYRAGTPSGCGSASSAMGPFYCPVDSKVYLDTEFFTTMSQRLGARGDFAAAYVVAHEVAHHVQNLLGILEPANALRSRSSQADSNAISVRIELQADCFSGVWARNAAERLGTLEEGDIAEAMNAAQQIGDDTLMRNAGQRPVEEMFTHGTSEQRQEAFATGYKAAAMGACEVFTRDIL